MHGKIEFESTIWNTSIFLLTGMQVDYIGINMVQLNEIGRIHTPYIDTAPYQPITDDSGVFKLILQEQYTSALQDVEKFRYIYVIYFLDRISPQKHYDHVSPPWAEGKQVGLFASRSPNRPNPIGLSIVEVKKIRGNVIYTSGLDVYDNTPLLDIKPYIQELDVKPDANYGWLQSDNKEDRDHLLLHIQGKPH